MGCSHSIPDNHPRMFKARNLNDNDKSVNSVVIEVQNTKVIVHSRNRKVMATWPISCLRRYGCTHDVLFIESGSGCDSGEGMYLFKCARTDEVFELLRQRWGAIQAERDRSLAMGHQLMPFAPAVPAQTVIPTRNQIYYNLSSPDGRRDEIVSNGSNGSGYANTNGSVHGFASLNSPLSNGPTTAVPRGSTSSQRALTGALASLPEDSALHLDASSQPFPLQPAPTSRKEMLSRRRFNSEVVATYNRNSDRVTLQSNQRRNSESTSNYENTELIDASCRAQVAYNSRTQQVKVNANRSAGGTPTSGHRKMNNGDDLTAVSPDAGDSASRDLSTMSLRSDCEPLLTPGSNGTSGVGSMNGNGQTLTPQNPPPVPPHPVVPLSISDPWKRQNFTHKFFPHHRLSPSYVPQSARDYVNTVNASMDVSGTPLPATAKASTHFNFDFDHLFRRVPIDRQKTLNYVPVEAFKSGDDFNCGASSASSGIPGTPRTPKTPVTNNTSTDYAIIDYKKTRALSNIHKARQRERKSRHGSSEAGLMNGV